MRALENYRGHEFIGVEELATAAASLIEHYSEEPGRGNVRLSITSRIVRHYLNEDLLGEPTGQAGTSLVFNYGNLLRLLAVKKLLAEHWSVVKIKEFMTALDITALEQLVNGALARLPPTASRAPQKTEEAPGERESAARFRALARRPAGVASAKPSPPVPTSFLASQPPPLASLVVESARRQERATAEWIELATGLEIKVRRSFRPPRNEQERERLAARFWSVINRNAKKASRDEE